MESVERPFGELPAALVDEVLKRTEDLSQKLLGDFEQVRTHRQEWRKSLVDSGLLRRDAELPYMLIPTTCGVDGSYAVERLLASDLVAAAAVAVEGLTPPSENAPLARTPSPRLGRERGSRGRNRHDPTRPDDRHGIKSGLTSAA